MPGDIVVISDTEEISDDDEEIAFVGITQTQAQIKSHSRTSGPSRSAQTQIPIFIDSDDDEEEEQIRSNSIAGVENQEILTILSSGSTSINTATIAKAATTNSSSSRVMSDVGLATDTIKAAVKSDRDRKGKRKAVNAVNATDVGTTGNLELDLMEVKALMKEFEDFENSIMKDSILTKIDSLSSLEIPIDTQLNSIEDGHEDIPDKAKKKPKKRQSSSNDGAATSEKRQRATTEGNEGGSIPPANKLSKEEKEALKAREKAEKQFQKDTAKAAKEAEKSYQRKLAEVNRLRVSKNDTVREIHLYLSSDLSHPKSPISAALPEIRKRVTDNYSELHFLTEDESPICGVIKFRRHLKARWDVGKKQFIPLEEPMWVWEGIVLVIVEAEEIVDKISSTLTSASSSVAGIGDGMMEEQEDLSSWISDIKLTLNLKKGDQVIVMIRGLNKYYSKTKSLANKEFTAAARAGLNGNATSSQTQGSKSRGKGAQIQSRPDKEMVEMALVELQVKQGCFLIHVEKTEDIEDWVYNIAADVAIRPYKLISKSHLNFCPSDGIRKASNPTETFELMLQEVTGITPSASMGIASEYPTFKDLMQSFERAERRGGVERAEGMLADCEIKTLRNGTANGRKLNKALAKRVYNVFRGEDSLALA